MNTVRKLVDYVLPPRCIVSGEIVEGQGMLSPTAWANLNFISDPQCIKCGYPFDFDDGIDQVGNMCAACVKEAPIYNQARAALFYDDYSRDVVLAYKHADQTQSVPTFLPWLNRVGKDILVGTDYIVPVPLHRWRLWRRRFNQAGLIAQYLSRDIQTPCILDLIVRHRATPTQGHLQANQRQKNVKNAFALNDKYAAQIKGKTITLIDDVYTTGATVNECTKVLLKAGASEVNILTLARVVKPVRG